MYIVLLTYTAPLDQVDAHLASHRDYLARHYASGMFLLSGRKEPREGGVILAQAASREALEAVLVQDPFHLHGVVRHEIVQFTPTLSSDALRCLVTP